MYNEKETAVFDKQQLYDDAIKEVIKILASKNLTIEEADDIMHRAIKRINQQYVQDV